jgi:hypothetical protein
MSSYPNYSKETTVSTYRHSDNSIHLFSGKELLSRIRLAARSIGDEDLGFSPSKLGLHSARSGASMAMYLGGVPVFTIMLLGRWSSEAFLWYIHKQVQEFSKGVSQRMTTNINFYNHFIRPTPHCASVAFSKNIGPNFKDTICPLANALRWFEPINAT